MKKILFFDIESTGLEITKDRIIQLSLVTTDIDFNILEKKKKNFSNCGVTINPGAFNAHGISEESLKEEYPFSMYAKSILTMFNDVDYIAGYNIKGFDIALLHEEFFRAGLDWNPKPAIDSGIIFKNREKRTLAAALKFYCNKEMVDAHDAENDVLATIEVLKGQIQTYDLDNLYTQKEEKYVNPIDGNIIFETVSEKYPLEMTLVLESSFDNENKRLTFDGKIILENGVACWGFSKFKGLPLEKADLGFINWFLGADFPQQTKSVFRYYFNQTK